MSETCPGSNWSLGANNPELILAELALASGCLFLLWCISKPVSDVLSAMLMDAVCFDMLSDYKLLSPAVPSTTRSKLEEIAESRSVSLEFEFQVDSPSTIKKLVSDNDFHCVFPYPAVAEEVARGEINAIEIVNPCPVLDLSIMMSKNTRSAYSLHSIESILHQQLTAMIETRFWKGVEDVYIDEEGQSKSN